LATSHLQAPFFVLRLDAQELRLSLMEMELGNERLSSQLGQRQIKPLSPGFAGI
jgi:hypothetical protein